MTRLGGAGGRIHARARQYGRMGVRLSPGPSSVISGAAVSAVRPAAFLAAFLAVVSGLSASCAAKGVPEVAVDEEGIADPVLEMGRGIYIKRCASCHGNDGKGGQGLRLSEGAVVEAYPDIADQIAVVADGYRAMPAFKDALTAEEIAAVIRFTREIL